MLLFAVSGVPVRAHPSLIAALGALLAWGAWTGGLAGAAQAGAVAGVLLGSVLAHELGHVAVARHFGVRTRSVLLLPFGGAAEMEIRFVHPRVDALVSAAGPAVSLGIGVALTAFGWGLSWWPAVVAGVLNLGLGAFNLLPAFPMDGGRMLRAMLAARWGTGPATRAAIALGAAFAVAFVVAGVAWREPGLLLVGAFMLVAQRREAQVLRQLGVR